MGTKSKSIDAAVEALLDEPELGAMKSWLEANAGGLETLQRANAVSRLLACDPVPVDVIRWLLEEGFDPNRTEGKDCLPTAALFTSRLKAPEKLEVLKLLDAHGADVNRISPYPDALEAPWRFPLELAVGYRVEPCVELILESTPSQDELIDALNYGLGLRRSAESLAPILSKIESLERYGRAGAAPIHVAAQSSDPKTVEELLGRIQEVNLPLSKSTQITVREASGGMLTPTLRCPAGSTALDIVLAAQGLLAAAEVPKKDEKRRQQKLQALNEIASLLREHGGRGGAFTEPYAVPYREPIDRALRRIAEAAGGDLEALARAGAFVDVERVGPWGYLSAVIERARASLTPAAGSELAATMAENWLGRFILGSAQQWPAQERKRRNLKAKAKLLKAKGYPAEAADAITQDLVVGGHEDRAIALWRIARDVGQVCLIAPDRFEILGRDPIDFVVRQTALLFGEPEPAPTTYMDREGPGSLVRLMLPDYEHEAGPKDVNRLGGLPIGVDADTWPRRDGAPMHHVLTVEVNATWLRKDIVAVALFVSDPDEHEAWAPSSDHVRLVFLTKEDVERGVVADWPEGLEGRRLRSGKMMTEAGDTLDAAELARRSYVGGTPSFLQEDEWQVIAHGPFLFQFNRDLVDMNLGDSGVMYAFLNTAWFQCL